MRESEIRCYDRYEHNVGEAAPVEQVTLRDRGRLELIPIWNEEIGWASEGGNTVLKNIRWGTLFRLWQD